ncbi:MAG: DUF2232 domain-containing protein [Bacteriovoracaceae bacterium]|nr:DUF2232 domain-containing protein [Bacteriovoracaceae bacterium]
MSYIRMNDDTTKFDKSGNEKQLTWAHLIFLGVSSVLLCSFAPLSIFAPFPLTMAFLLYGNLKTWGMGLGCFLLLSVLSFQYEVPQLLSGLFVVAFFYALLLSRIIWKQIHPQVGFVKTGLILVSITFGIVFLIAIISEKSLLGQLEEIITSAIMQFKTQNPSFLKGGGNDARVLQDLFANPKDIAKEILYWGPATIFISVFIGLWPNLFMVLRNGRVWRKKIHYQYLTKDFIHFRVPEIFVWPLIVSLVLLLGGEYIIGEFGPIIGGNLLYSLGIFYFFQGVGIYLDLLTHLRIFRFFRTMLLVFTTIMAWKVLALIGVFDMWINFRKFFKKNNNNKSEGDNT